MKFIGFSLILILIFSCTDENLIVSRTKQEQLDLDLKRIKGYINENNLEDFQPLDNGIHYKI